MTNDQHPNAETRDTELGDLINATPIAEHRSDFWGDLETQLDEQPGRFGSPETTERLVEVPLTPVASLTGRGNRHVLVGLAVAATIVVVAGFAVLAGRIGDPQTNGVSTPGETDSTESSFDDGPTTELNVRWPAEFLAPSIAALPEPGFIGGSFLDGIPGCEGSDLSSIGSAQAASTQWGNIPATEPGRDLVAALAFDFRVVDTALPDTGSFDDIVADYAACSAWDVDPLNRGGLIQGVITFEQTELEVAGFRAAQFAAHFGVGRSPAFGHLTIVEVGDMVIVGTNARLDTFAMIDIAQAEPQDGTGTQSDEDYYSIFREPISGEDDNLVPEIIEQHLQTLGPVSSDHIEIDSSYLFGPQIPVVRVTNIATQPVQRMVLTFDDGTTDYIDGVVLDPGEQTFVAGFNKEGRTIVDISSVVVVAGDYRLPQVKLTNSPVPGGVVAGAHPPIGTPSGTTQIEYVLLDRDGAPISIQGHMLGRAGELGRLDPARDEFQNLLFEFELTDTPGAEEVTRLWASVP